MIHIESRPAPRTSSLSRKASSAQPIVRGSRPLVMTLWVMTVSEAMCPTHARGKSTPSRMSARTLGMANVPT